MSHEWECATRYGVYNLPDCICDWLRVAYQRGREDAAKAVEAEIWSGQTDVISAARGDGEQA